MHIHKISTRDVRFQLAARAGSDTVAGSDVEELMADWRPQILVQWLGGPGLDSEPWVFRGILPDW
jgi:hypothetical protein